VTGTEPAPRSLIRESRSRRGIFHLFSGAGNRFFLHQGAIEERDWSRLAGEICRNTAVRGGGADGLLLVSPDADAEVRMTIWNADGSRPEACGNGLRCVGWWLHTSGRVPRGGRMRVATDSGVREVEVLESTGGRALVRAEMGRATTFELTEPPSLDEVAAMGVHLGNPHCVLRIDDEREAPVEEVGSAMQDHPDFPRGVNVGFLARRLDRWRLRVFERGVGETAACGTGACAAAAVIGTPGRRVEVEMAGGRLGVEVGEGGRVELLGDAVYHGEVELELSTWRSPISRP
jgi:diaminopimelate epimerase